MNEQTYQPAPLDVMAKRITFLVVALILGIGLMPASSFWTMAAIAGALTGVTYLFSVRAYRISAEHFTVVHPFWERAWELSTLTETFTPSVGMRSIRLFGSGGYLGYLGWFRNRELGNYLAFVTDRTNMVGLHFGSRTIVISPANPLAFADDLKAMAQM